MIADNGSRKRKKPLRVAIEDAITVFAAIFLSQLLIAMPGLPTFEQIYGAAVVGAVFGVAAWGKARNIQIPGGA